MYHRAYASISNYVFNNILATGDVPDSWVKSFICPLLKKGSIFEIQIISVEKDVGFIAYFLILEKHTAAYGSIKHDELWDALERKGWGWGAGVLFYVYESHYIVNWNLM